MLYIVGQKARESSDTGMSVRHIPGHWKINKALALLLLIGRCSAYVEPEGGTGGPDPPRKSQKYSFLAILVPIPSKS